MPYEGPGRYIHHKGGEYIVHGLACREEETDEVANFNPRDTVHQYVIYEPMSAGSLLYLTGVRFWERKLDNFNGLVKMDDGLTVPRFLKIK